MTSSLLRMQRIFDYSNIRISNIRIVNLIFKYSFVLINLLIGLNRATIHSRWHADQVVLIIITLLFGAQQSVLGRDAPCLDSPKCLVLCLQSNAGFMKETNSE